MNYTYPIHLHHIFISPGHNYFGRPKEGPGTHATLDVATVDAVTGKGLQGDRYFGVAAHFNAQVTLIALEVWAALLAEFGLAGLSPSLTRRNIVLAGVPLNPLIGQEFAIEANGQQVLLLGAKACSPCAWMDVMIAPGAHKFLRGRGGLRARIVQGNQLQAGPAQLHTTIALDLATISAPLALPRLP